MSGRIVGHPLAARVALLVVSIAVALVLAEVIVRLTRPQPSYYPRYLYMADTGVGYRLRPGFSGVLEREEFRVRVAINALGFRGPEVATTKTAPVRVLLLGDSQTFGWGVPAEDTFAARLAASFPHAEIVNGGVPGYGTVHQLEFYRKYGAPLRPDLVVLLFNDNDPEDNFYGISRTVVGGYLVPGSSQSKPLQWLITYIADVSDAAHLATERLRRMAFVYRTIRDRPPELDEQQALAVTREAIAALAGEVRRSGARLVVAFARGTHRAALAPTLRDADLPSLDLDAVLAGERDIAFPRDRHWNTRGHALVADALTRWLPIERPPSPR